MFGPKSKISWEVIKNLYSLRLGPFSVNTYANFKTSHLPEQNFKSKTFLVASLQPMPDITVITSKIELFDLNSMEITFFDSKRMQQGLDLRYSLQLIDLSS